MFSRPLKLTKRYYCFLLLVHLHLEPTSWHPAPCLFMYQRLQIYCITLFNMFGCIYVTNYIVITLFVHYGLVFNRHLVSNAMKRIGQMRDKSRITKATINVVNLFSMYSQLNISQFRKIVTRCLFYCSSYGWNDLYNFKFYLELYLFKKIYL